ncbi:conserved hypothetical protein [Vibrio jasicida]|uniref:Uncharacterized protein n=2 Tax=Vibrio harveyi group TaxID=717610 RepID=A0AAU9QY66_9VIBR|nr:conserved hypothetical protein [Vibrio jasicida]CAH1602504.1 conserved hypothetical protein [Vibrio jasicida]
MKRSMKAIALFGAADVGKSSALKTLDKQLKELIEVSSERNIDHVTDQYLCCLSTEGVDIATSYRLLGKVVGVVSGGGTPEAMKEDIERLESQSKLDILVCATRSKGKTEAFLHEMVGEENIIWLQCPWVYPEQEYAIKMKTQSMATLLFDMLIAQIHNATS